MIFRTILYALMFYGVFWLVQRILRILTGISSNRTTGFERTRRHRYDSKAVDAEFEEIDDNEASASKTQNSKEQ